MNSINNRTQRQRKKEQMERITDKIFEEHPEIRKFLVAKEKFFQILIVVGIAVHIAWYLTTGLWQESVLPAWIWLATLSFFLYVFSQKTAIKPWLLLIMNILILLLELISYISFITINEDSASWGTGMILSFFLTLFFHLTVCAVSLILCLPKYHRMMRLFHEKYMISLQCVQEQERLALLQETQRYEEVSYEHPGLWNWMQKRLGWIQRLVQIGFAAHTFWVVSQAISWIRNEHRNASLLAYLCSLFFWMLAAYGLRACFENKPKTLFLPLLISVLIFLVQMVPSASSGFGDTPVRICFVFLYSLGAASSGISAGGFGQLPREIVLPYNGVTVACSACITLLYLLAFATMIMMILPKSRRQIQQLHDLARNKECVPQGYAEEDNENNGCY